LHTKINFFVESIKKIQKKGYFSLIFVIFRKVGGVSAKGNYEVNDTECYAVGIGFY